MNNKTNKNFSLRKLLLTALVAGPLATLPAPLWALPQPTGITGSATTTNLTVSNSTTITANVVSATNLQVTATADKGVLTWQEFGNGVNPISAGDTIQYFLPSASSSILNLVSPSGTASTAATTIAGTISSNGNVYLLNPNGIVLSSTAQINTGGFYASTVNESLAAAMFAMNGSLSFVGTSTAAVTVNGATFQSLGTGNNVVLYGRNVDVNGATVYGNLSVNAVGGTNQNVTFAGASLSNPGAVTINKIGSSGGNLVVNSNGGNVILSGLGVAGSASTTIGASPSAVTGSSVSTGSSGYPALANIPATFRGAPAGGVTAQGYVTTDAAGSVNGIVITNAGAGYTSAPTVTIPLPGTAFPAVTTAVQPTYTLTGTTSTINGTTGVATANAISYGGPAGAYAPSTTVYGLGSATSTGASPAVSYATNATGQVVGGVGGVAVINNAGSGLTTAPNITFANPTTFGVTVAGNLTINTANNSTNLAGSVSQLDGDSLVTVAGTTTITAGTTGASPVYGTISLPTVDLATLIIPTAGSTSVTDAAGGLILGNANITATNASTNLTINVGATNSGRNLTMASGAKVQVIPTATYTTPSIKLTGASVTLTGTGVMAFSGLSTSTSSGAVTVSTDNNILIGTTGTDNIATKTLSLTTTGGTISMNNLSTSSATATLTASGNITMGTANTSGALTLKSNTGTITAGNIAVQGASSITAVGDISLANVAASSGVTITSSAGSVTATGGLAGSGTITAANNISFGVASLSASADRGSLNVPTSGNNNTVLSGAAANGPTSGSVTGIGVSLPSGLGYAPSTTIPVTLSGNATAYASTNALGQVTGVTVVNPGSAYTSGPTSTFAAPTNSVVANGALTLTATNGSVALGGPVVSTSTSALTINSAQSVALPAVTAPTLSVKSTAGSITQTGAVVASGTATLDAATDITLSNTANNFGTVVLKNGGGGSTGISITDVNDIVLGGGTDAKGNVSITSGAGVTATSFTTQAALVGSATLNTNSSVALAAPVTAGSYVVGQGYTISSLGSTDFTLIGASANTVGLSFIATGVGAGTGIATQAGPNALPALRPATSGASGIVTGVTVNNAGSGYAPSSTAAITFSAPPVNNPAAAITTAGSTTSNGYNLGPAGEVLGVTILNTKQLGNNYTPNSTVAVTFPVPAAVGSVQATGIANTNGNGQITSITMTNLGSGYVAGDFAGGITFAASTAGAQETGSLVTSSTGTVSSVVVDSVGTKYYGAYSPVLIPVTNFAVPAGAAAKITGLTTSAAGAITGITIAGGSNYASAPTLNFGAGAAGTSGAVASTTVIGGAVQSVTTPLYSGGVTLGSASTDSIKIAGNLTLTTTSPAGTAGILSPSANWSQFNTVANNVYVGGNLNLNTSGTNANIGLNPLGGGALYSFGAVNFNSSTVAGTAGSLNVIENTTLNLGTITTAGAVNATSLSGDIVNSGPITTSGILTVAANSVFSPGNVTLNNTGNRIDQVTIQNANNFTLVDLPTAAGVTVIAGNTNPGKTVVGTTNISVSGGKNATLTATNAGDYNVVSFNMSGGNGNFSVTDPNNVTISNAANVGSGNVSVTATGVISLGSGIVLNSTGLATFTANGSTANITDISPNIFVAGRALLQSDQGISITQSGHSFGPVSLTSGKTGSAAATGSNVDIVYTEAGTANLNVVQVNQVGILTAAGGPVAGNLTVVSTAGGIIQTPVATATTSVIRVPGSSMSASFTAASGSGVNLTNPNFSATAATPVNNAIVAPISIRAGTDSSVAQVGAITLGNVAVTTGAFTADASSAALGALGYGISQSTGSTIFSYGNSTFKTNGGAITIANSGNNFGALTLTSNNGTLAPTTATSAAAPAQVGGVLTVGTYAVPVGTSGTGYPVNSTTVPVTVTGPVGAGAVATATTDAYGRVASIQLTNGGAGYTGAGAFTLAAGGALSTTGADISIKEGGTMNLAQVNTGTAGNLTAQAETGGIIQTGNLGVTAGTGKSVSLLAGANGITLNTGNNFGGSGISLTTTGNVTLQDANANTILASGTNVGGTLTVRNTVNGTLKDAGGNVKVSGNVLFDVGTGAIQIVGSGNSFGAVQFRGNAVSIAEDTTFNLNAGSVASGQVTLSTIADFITSGLGTSTFAGTVAPSLTVSAGGKITITNPIFVANGLTFRALGAVDLSALSLIGNLNGIAPTNWGSSSYKAPAP